MTHLVRVFRDYVAVNGGALCSPPPRRRQGDSGLLSACPQTSPCSCPPPPGAVSPPLPLSRLCSLFRKRSSRATIRRIDRPRRRARCGAASDTRLLQSVARPGVWIFLGLILLLLCWLLWRAAGCPLWGGIGTVVQSRIWRPACCPLMASRLSSSVPLEPGLLLPIDAASQQSHRGK